MKKNIIFLLMFLAGIFLNICYGAETQKTDGFSLKIERLLLLKGKSYRKERDDILKTLTIDEINNIKVDSIEKKIMLNILKYRILKPDVFKDLAKTKEFLWSRIKKKRKSFPKKWGGGTLSYEKFIKEEYYYLDYRTASFLYRTIAEVQFMKYCNYNRTEEYLKKLGTPDEHGIVCESAYSEYPYKEENSRAAIYSVLEDLLKGIPDDEYKEQYEFETIMAFGDTFNDDFHDRPERFPLVVEYFKERMLNTKSQLICYAILSALFPPYDDNDKPNPKRMKAYLDFLKKAFDFHLKNKRFKICEVILHKYPKSYRKNNAYKAMRLQFEIDLFLLF